MAVSFLMTTDKDLNCGYIHIADATVYSSAFPDREEDYARAWWVFEDGAFYDANLSNENDWDVSVSNNHTYTIYGFLVAVWIAGTYADGCIVYYGGSFYVNDTGAPIGPGEIPGVSGNGWTVLTDTSGDFNDFYNSGCVQMEDATEIIDCPDYTLQKQSCYVHRLCDNSGSALIKQVTIMDYEGTVIDTVYIDPATATCYDIDITASGDGVYPIQIQTGNMISGEFVSDGTDSSWMVIYEYCAYENCTWFTIDKILCSSDPCAEICDPCNPNTVNQQTKDRQTLNQLIATFGSVMAMIHVERIRYLGIFDWNTSRSTYVTKIGMMLRKVKELAVRCGLCYGQTVNNPNANNVTFTAVITQGTGTSTCTDCQ